MAAKRNKKPLVTKYDMPSRFGSHSSMINMERSKTLTNPSLVVLTDEYGDYLTEKSRLDSGLADPNRYKNYAPKSMADPNLKDAFGGRLVDIEGVTKK